MPAVVAEKISLEKFRAQYADRKPYFELIDGVPIQKALPTSRHSTLQLVLSLAIRDLGFRAKPELTLAISNEWEPIPDVSGVLEHADDPYPTKPIAVAIEILSPDDKFSLVQRKCRKYAEWGIPDILVFDPVDRKVWHWDRPQDGLVPIRDIYRFHSLSAELVLSTLWQRFDDELSS